MLTRDIGEAGELAKAHGAVTVLLAVLFLSAARDAFVLLRYPVAVGIDGYYYVLQVHELLARGQLYFPTGTPLVFYVLAALAALTGDTVLAIKIGSIALNLALCAGLYALVSYSTRSRWLGVLACSIAAVSAMHFYMVAEFIKNLCAVALLVWCWWAAIRAVRDRRLCWTITAAVLFIAAVCSHRSAWALASAIFAFGVLLRPLFTKDYLNRRKVPALLAAIFLAISPALVAAQPFIGLPEWLGREVLARPQWPVHLGSPFGTLEMTALLVVSPLTLLLLRRLSEIPPTPHFTTIMGGVALWSLLITLNPFLNHDVRQLGVVGRLDHLMYVQLGILIPGLIWLTSHAQRKALVVLLPLTALFLVVSGLSPLPKGLRPQYALNRSQMIRALSEHRQQLGLSPLVIAQHGDEFVVTWALGVPAQQRLPDDTDGHTVYWLLHHVRQSDLTNSMIVVMEEEDDFCLVLVRHEELTQWLSIMTEAEQNQLLTYNPQLEGRLLPGSRAAAR
jgi:hypothetical protein